MFFSTLAKYERSKEFYNNCSYTHIKQRSSVALQSFNFCYRVRFCLLGVLLYSSLCKRLQCGVGCMFRITKTEAS